MNFLFVASCLDVPQKHENPEIVILGVISLLLLMIYLITKAKVTTFSKQGMEKCSLSNINRMCIVTANCKLDAIN